MNALHDTAGFDAQRSGLDVANLNIIDDLQVSSLISPHNKADD
jgi:hypothetical protein